jgi:ABC-type multidrug transport system fused ATPase/permease subunit
MCNSISSVVLRGVVDSLMKTVLTAGFLRRLQDLRPLWDTLSRRRRRQLAALQGLSVLAALGEVANLGALLPFLQLLAQPEEGLQALGPLALPLRALSSQHLLLTLGLGFMAVVVASSLLRAFTILMQLRLGALIAADLGEQVFARVLDLPYAWHLQHNSSSTLSFLTKDVDQVYSSIQSILLLVVNLALLLLLGGSLIALAPGMMVLVCLLLTSFYLLVFRFTRATLRSDGERLTRGYQSSLQIAQEGLGGIRDVLLDQTQGFFVDAFRGSNLSYRLAIAAINIRAQIPRYLIEGFAILLIVAVSLSMALSGQGIDRQLPLLGTLALGAYRLMQPLQQCFSALGSLKANQASLLRLQPFLDTNHHQLKSELTVRQVPLSIKYKSVPPLIQLQNVDFRYTIHAPLVLRKVNLTLGSGERLGFAGSTGSGKSTLSDLILGLLQPSSGHVLVQGKDLHSSQKLESIWRDLVSHVPQQVYLSDASFASNIAFGLPSHRIDFQKVRRSAEQAQIAEFIEASSEGYNTLVGERGLRLSGGQRQRIGIARALYKQARLIVLDEATSALDNLTEADVMDAIEALDRRLTVILIAHRLSTLRHCDRIVLLEEGRILTVGTYQQLEAENHYFRSMIQASQSFPA